MILPQVALGRETGVALPRVGNPATDQAAPHYVSYGGPAYAAWTGIGAPGAGIIGMGWLGETTSVLTIASITLVLAGIVGLQLSGASG